MADTALRMKEQKQQKSQQQQQSKQCQQQQQQQRELRFGQMMLAGSFAGIVEHTAMFPVDTVKTRLQMLLGPCGSVHSISKAIASIFRHEGPAGFYKGLGAMVLGAGPSHAVHFAFYEFCKDKYTGGDQQGNHTLAHMAAGASATVASDAVLTPMDVVKQRLQLSRSPYAGVVDCARRILKEEGVRGFYASYRTTVLMNIPFSGVHFAAYEAGKKLLSDVSPQFTGEDDLLTHLLAGGAAGALASGFTTPLDVVKTRLQCQGVSGAVRFRTSSVSQAVSQIVAREGWRALFRGLHLRVLFHTPAAAITWSTYEGAKAFLESCSS